MPNLYTWDVAADCISRTEKRQQEPAQGSCILCHHHFIMCNKKYTTKHFLYLLLGIKHHRPNRIIKVSEFYLTWNSLAVAGTPLLHYLETTVSRVFRFLRQQAGEENSFPLITEGRLDTGSSLEEKLARSLLAQIQKEQIEKGWDDWTLLYSMVCPLCQAAQSLWCYLCHLSCTLRLGCCAQKNMMHYQRLWMGFPSIFLKERDSPFDSPHLLKNWVSLIKRTSSQ